MVLWYSVSSVVLSYDLRLNVDSSKCLRDTFLACICVIVFAKPGARGLGGSDRVEGAGIFEVICRCRQEYGDPRAITRREKKYQGTHVPNSEYREGLPKSAWTLEALTSFYQSANEITYVLQTAQDKKKRTISSSSKSEVHNVQGAASSMSTKAGDAVKSSTHNGL